MAASSAGVFWRAARPSDLAYRHTIAAAARWLGCRYRERHEHGHYATRHATFLSPAGRANLLTKFRREYEVLAALEAGPGRVALA